MRLHLDLESYSECNLKTCGAYRYAEDPSTELLCAAFAFDDGPVHLWLPYERFELPEGFYAQVKTSLEPGAKLYLDGQVPEVMRSHLAASGQLRAHNANFERTILNGHVGQALGVPRIEIEQTVCTAAKCAEYGLPRALDKAANAAGTHPKNQSGKPDMMAVTKPRSGSVKRYTPHNSPERFLKLYAYNMDDVRAERALDDFVPELSRAEQTVYELDQRMNDRGVRVDLTAIDNMRFLIAEHLQVLEKRCLKLVGVKPTQRQKIVDWIREQNFKIPDMQAQTVLKILKRKDVPKKIRRVLKIYSIYNMKAPTKLAAMLRAVCRDGCLHGMFLFYGANTGRWSSLIVQLQNLFRPKIKETGVAIEAMAARDLEWIRTLYDLDPMIIFASCIRGMLIAKVGRDILALDFKSIEARIVAWLAGAKDILEVFRGHGKIYEHTAAKIYKKLIKLITEDERFIGKIAVLALGYQGAKAAFMKMAKQFNVDISEAFADRIVREWRAANPKITKLWVHMNAAAIKAVRFSGETFSIPNGLISFKVSSNWLYMVLPSGRRLSYFKPSVSEDKQATNEQYRFTLHYWGIDTYTRAYCKCDTYGGKLLQNACEGIARDLLVAGLFKLENAGYDPIGSVHDEGLMEPTTTHGSIEEAKELICSPLPWAVGLPVAVSGFRESQYRK